MEEGEADVAFQVNVLNEAGMEPASGYESALTDAAVLAVAVADATAFPIAQKDTRIKAKQKIPPPFPDLIYGYHYNDVLSGRGATVNSHPGNRRFRSLCADRKVEFDAATNAHKREIALEVVEIVLGWNPPGRFIERVNDVANCIPEEVEAFFREVECERVLTGFSAAYFNRMGFTFKRNKRLMRELGPWRDMGIERAIQKVCGVIRDHKRPDRIALRAMGMLREKKSTKAYTNDRRDEEHDALAIHTKDEDTSTVYWDIVPTPNDVLLGRGAFINDHSGNRRFRTLALEHKLHFDAASPTNRRQLALEIVSLTKALNPPGRFLRRSPHALQEPVLLSDGKYQLPPRGLEGPWEEVIEEQACAKATQVMRDIKLQTAIGITFGGTEEASVMASKNGSDLMDIRQEMPESQGRDDNIGGTHDDVILV